MGKKSTNFLDVAKGRIKLLYAKKNKLSDPFVVGHPIDMYHTLKNRAKGLTATGAKIPGAKPSKHASLKALGNIVRLRVVNGPELNIVLAGIPFLIDCGVASLSNAASNKKAKKAAAAAKAAPPPQKEIKLAVKQKPASTSPPPALEPKPHSDKFVPLQTHLVAHGMSKDEATKIAEGFYGDRDLQNELSQDDLAALIHALSELEGEEQEASE